jgi:hypothetical protein
LFLGHGETEYHGGKVWWNKVAHLIVARKQRGGQEGAIDMPLVTYVF